MRDHLIHWTACIAWFSTPALHYLALPDPVLFINNFLAHAIFACAGREILIFGNIRSLFP